MDINPQNIIEDKKGSQDINSILNQLNLYKTFFDNYYDSVFIIDPDTMTFLDANDSGCKLLGVEKKKIIGTGIGQFRRLVKLLKKEESPVVLSEISLQNDNDESLMIEASARFIDFDKKRIIQAIAKNVTQEYHLTDRLVQSDKLVLLGQLIASVAHEIRNPLAAINLNLQLLQRDMLPESRELEQVNTALQGVERITKIVETTLNFSRITAPEILEININNVIPKTLEIFTSTLKKKQIELELSLYKDLPLVLIDEKHILQVFVNLIKNASDAISSNGKITLKTFIEANPGNEMTDYVVFSITDSGCGISPDDLTKIFNPFFTKKEEGTGLGLPICQRLIHQYNGNIDVESVLGIGTTFYIKLPAISI